MISMQAFLVCASVVVLLSDRVASAPSSDGDDAADVAAREELKPYLDVTYTLTTTDGNLNDVLADLGFSDAQIKQAAQNKPWIKLSFTPNTYTLERQGGSFGNYKLLFPLSSKATTSAITNGPIAFPRGETFFTMTQKKNVIKQLVTWEDWVVSTETVEKSATFEYEFTKTVLKLKIKTKDHVTVQTYVKKGPN